MAARLLTCAVCGVRQSIASVDGQPQGYPTLSQAAASGWGASRDGRVLCGWHVPGGRQPGSASAAVERLQRLRDALRTVR